MPLTPVTDKQFIFNLLESIEQAIATSLTTNCSYPVASKWRRIIGWANPPDDCCPAIIVWADNIRPNPVYDIPGQQSTPGCPPAWLIDVNVRVADCYVDVNPESPDVMLQDQNIAALTQGMLHLTHCAYFGFYCRWVSGQVDEITLCTPVALGGLTTYAEGACGGVEFTITVSTI